MMRESSDERSIAVELLGEREGAQGWEYDAQVLWSDTRGTRTRLQRLVLKLSWVDYQHWASDGSVPPSRIAEAVLQFIARHNETFAGIEQIDASTARRRVHGADEAIRTILAGE